MLLFKNTLLLSCQVFGFEVFSEQQLLVLNDPTRARAIDSLFPADSDLVADSICVVCWNVFWMLLGCWALGFVFARVAAPNLQCPQIVDFNNTESGSTHVDDYWVQISVLLLSIFAGFASVFAAPYMKSTLNVQAHVVFVFAPSTHEQESKLVCHKDRGLRGNMICKTGTNLATLPRQR